MNLKKAKSIEELYDEVRDYGLVFTNDAPLNTALNKSVEKSFLGDFALTARLAGSKFCDIYFEDKKCERYELVLNISYEFGISFKEAMHYVENIMSIYEYTGEIDTIKNYVSSFEERIIDYLRGVPFYQRGMELFDEYYFNSGDEKVGVLGYELFSEIDKKVIPKNHDKISVFKDDYFKMDPIYVFDNSVDIVERTVSMINTGNQDNVAIVLNVESPYLSILKSKLISKGIDINESFELFYDLDIRNFIVVIETAYVLEYSLVRDLKPVFEILGFEYNRDYEDYYLLEVLNKDEELKEFHKFVISLRDKKLGECINILNDLGISVSEKFVDLVTEFGFYDKKIDYDSILEIKYIVENINIKTDKSRRGVLFVDAKNSAYINRDIVFYVGIDYDWTKKIDKTPYYNYKDELYKDMQRFEILLQQGVQRFYFVSRYTNGEETYPPIYFSLISGESVDSFSEDFFELYSVVNDYNYFEENKRLGVDEETNTDEVKKKNYLSTSSLNKFVECPKKYSYSEIIKTGGKKHFVKGNCIHYFAEFYVNHKEFAKENFDECMRIFYEKIKPFIYSDVVFEYEKTNIYYGCLAVIDFIDMLNIEDISRSDIFKNSVSEKSSKSEENILYKYFNKEPTLKSSEVRFYSDSVKCSGIIDLIVNNSFIVDYKSGRKKGLSEVYKKSNIKEIITQCDFQPLVYITYLREINPNEEIYFWYNYPLLNVFRRFTQRPNFEEEVSEICYIPESFRDFLLRGKFIDFFYPLASQKVKGIIELIGDFSYFEDKDLDKILEYEPEKFAQDYLEDFMEYFVRVGGKDNKGSRGGAFDLLKQIIEFKRGKKNKQKTLYYFRDDIDRFEDFVKFNLDKMNGYYMSYFPYNPVEGEDTCSMCDFKSYCLRRFE